MSPLLVQEQQQQQQQQQQHQQLPGQSDANMLDGPAASLAGFSALGGGSGHGLGGGSELRNPGVGAASRSSSGSLPPSFPPPTRAMSAASQHRFGPPLSDDDSPAGQDSQRRRKRDRDSSSSEDPEARRARKAKRRKRKEAEIAKEEKKQALADKKALDQTAKETRLAQRLIAIEEKKQAAVQERSQLKNANDAAKVLVELQQVTLKIDKALPMLSAAPFASNQIVKAGLAWRARVDSWTEKAQASVLNSASPISFTMQELEQGVKEAQEAIMKAATAIKALG